jgi:MFS family permease
MIYILFILRNRLQSFKNNEQLITHAGIEDICINPSKYSNIKWILDLMPLLSLTLFVTGVMNLMQSILPLDIANGGLIRPPLIEERVASLLTIKMILLAIFQWPVGYILRNKSSSIKFELCLISLLIGSIFLSLSNFLFNGYLLILIAFIPLTISLCIFLPSASDAIIKSTPRKYHGSAIALYSQCFGISALTIPWIAGKLIDNYNTAFQLWLIVSLICIFLLPICRKIN